MIAWIKKHWVVSSCVGGPIFFNLLLWLFFPEYFWNFWIAIDQLFNAIFFGDPDETISSRMGKVEWTNDFANWLCAWLDLIDSDHCKDAIETDRGK